MVVFDCENSSRVAIFGCKDEEFVMLLSEKSIIREEGEIVSLEGVRE